MKTILILLSFMFVFCVTSGVKTRAVASEDAPAGSCMFNGKIYLDGARLTVFGEGSYICQQGVWVEKSAIKPDTINGKMNYEDCMIDCFANGGSTRGCPDMCE